MEHQHYWLVGDHDARCMDCGIGMESEQCNQWLNAHDRLVEALEAECYECVLVGGGSIWHLNRCGVTNGTADCISDCVKARSALALARGEGE